jgi:hypothetical protein
MSSKSSKHSKHPSQPHTPAGETHGAGAKHVQGEVEFAEPTEKDFLEEELKTPKGKSPFVYAFLVLLLLFLTVLFVLPDGAMQGWGSSDRVEVRWNDPVLGARELMTTELENAHARYEVAFDNMAGMAAFPVGGYGFLSDPQDLSDLDILRLVIADERASAAGVEITDAELANTIRTLFPFFGGAANYERRLRAYTNIGGVRGFEETIRGLMRIQRYVELTGLAAIVPSRTDIEAAWNAGHREFRFEWAAADLASFEEAAKATPPTEEELSTWLAGLTEFERAPYMTPVAFRAEIAGFQLAEGLDTTKLDALFPRPATWDDAVEGESFYKQRYFTLYAKPAATPEGDEAVAPPTEYFSYEEIKDRAARDARLFAALRDWQTALQGRIAIGETVDLEAEAASIGASFQRNETPQSFDALTSLGGLASTQVASRISSLTVAGEIAPTIVVSPTSLAIVRLVERVEPTLPPIADIREKVEATWYENKRIDLAEAALNGLRETLLAAPAAAEGEPAPAQRTTVTSEEFFAAATAAGLRTGTRDWLDRRATQAQDPNWNDVVHTLVRSNASLFALEEGALSAMLSPLGTLDAYYIVRAAGQREIPFERIDSSAYQQASQQARQMAALAYLRTGPFSDEALRTQLGLWVRAEEERAAAEAAAKEAAQNP